MDEIDCKHYIGDGYTYKITSGKISINLCEKCENDLYKKMLKQHKIEKEIDEYIKNS
ncbi:MAG TPA: hypothetical protein VGB37_00665 [Candidatus Lokiarchaeia archaeon]